MLPENDWSQYDYTSPLCPNSILSDMELFYYLWESGIGFFESLISVQERSDRRYSWRQPNFYA